MKTTLVMVGVIVCALSVVACHQARPTKLSPEFGKSANLVVENQILNPDAPVDLEPVEGLNGKASLKLLQEYQKSFEGRRRETANTGLVIAPPKRQN